jgi:hypothetical protein
MMRHIIYGLTGVTKELGVQDYRLILSTSSYVERLDTLCNSD